MPRATPFSFPEMLLRDQTDGKAAILTPKKAVSVLGFHSPLSTCKNIQTETHGKQPARRMSTRCHGQDSGSRLQTRRSHWAAFSTHPQGRVSHASQSPQQGASPSRPGPCPCVWAQWQAVSPEHTAPSVSSCSLGKRCSAGRGNELWKYQLHRRCRENKLLFRRSWKNCSALNAALCKSPHNKQGQSHSSTLLTAITLYGVLTPESRILPLGHTGGLCKEH